MATATAAAVAIVLAINTPPPLPILLVHYLKPSTRKIWTLNDSYAPYYLPSLPVVYNSLVVFR